MLRVRVPPGRGEPAARTRGPSSHWAPQRDLLARVRAERARRIYLLRQAGAEPPAMTTGGLLGAWVFTRDTPLAAMVAASQDGLTNPDLRVRLLSSTGDTITADLLYVERRGACEPVRREEWPGRRPLLTLAAWPSR